MAGVNDAPHHAASLAKLLKRYDLRSHVNLIPFNAVAGASFGTPSRVGAAAFAAALTEAGVPASVRVNRGADATRSIRIPRSSCVTSSSAPGENPARSRSEAGITTRPALSMVVLMA